MFTNQHTLCYTQAKQVFMYNRLFYIVMLTDSADQIKEYSEWTFRLERKLITQAVKE